MSSANNDQNDTIMANCLDLQRIVWIELFVKWMHFCIFRETSTLCVLPILASTAASGDNITQCKRMLSNVHSAQTLALYFIYVSDCLFRFHLSCSMFVIVIDVVDIQQISNRRTRFQFGHDAVFIFFALFLTEEWPNGTTAPFHQQQQ